ncbi:glycoside hydrolase superfamily [Multifurca ochricompacta]|uniref:glucan 1,3-beta-glucosidase n=1 Tax=Multifurca ochricompacta TaxID=376703 RepID=A0AAD4MBD4_9AGAM|nr:glycoside hydrolase superfamily [Multifurca ochricompacta]
MSRQPVTTHGIAYDPVPNPQGSQDHPFDTQEIIPTPTPYDPHSEHAMPTTPLDDDMNLDEPSINLVRPRFLGTIDGEGIRESLASFSSRPQGSPHPQGDTFSGRYRDDPRSSDDVYDGPSVPLSTLASQPRFLKEKQAVYATSASKSRRNTIILAALAGLVILIAAVVIPIYFLVIKHHSNGAAAQPSHSTTASPSSTNSPSSPKSAIVTGGDGSTVTIEDGTTFIYRNSFGGYWYHDPNDPLNNGARAQSWTPALNETFRYGIDHIRGVNLGGWLNTEPFITPALYQKYPGVIDEWGLSLAMANDTASGGLSQLESHYKTFITEKDFADIAGAGLNYVRIPLPYWAIETWNGEPFLAKTSWQYFLKAIGWARKYGIRINLDFHALPGSQNGWNHSGKLGTINVLYGPMGLANAQRSLDYIRIISEFISQPEYKDVVTMFGVTNEPQAPAVGQDNLSRYYLQAYNAVRQASGIGAGNGPMISYHDGFAGVTNWAGFLPGADRISLDFHPYLCFGSQTSSPMSSNVNRPCSTWGSTMNDSMSAFGLTVAGEFSNAINDCGLYVNGVGLGARYDGTYQNEGPWPTIGDCGPWTSYSSWSQDLKDSTKQFALASMDALQNWFFWTWKIGNSSISGDVEAPAWSYKLGLDNGWMPLDPRGAAGACGNSNPWQPPLAPSQTGGSGAGQIPASVSSQYLWPPTVISNAGAAVTLLPQYTQTGTIPTLPVPSFTSTSSSINAGNGWANPSDTVGLAVPIASCSYLSPWVESPAALPPACGTQTAGTRREVATDGPKITPAPVPSR